MINLNKDEAVSLEEFAAVVKDGELVSSKGAELTDEPSVSQSVTIQTHDGGTCTYTNQKEMNKCQPSLSIMNS